MLDGSMVPKSVPGHDASAQAFFGVPEGPQFWQPYRICAGASRTE